MKIKVDQELINQIERAQYDCITRQEVVSIMLEKNNPEVLKGQVFKDYSQQMCDAKKEYEDAKREMEALSIPEKLRGHQLNWNLDFRSGILTVEALCDCGKKVMEELDADTKN